MDGEIRNIAMDREHAEALEFIRLSGAEARREFDKLRASSRIECRSPFLEDIEYLLWLRPIRACAQLDIFDLAKATLYYSTIEGRALGAKGNPIARLIVTRSRKLRLNYTIPGNRMGRGTRERANLTVS